jgi:hypothetical protein
MCTKRFWSFARQDRLPHERLLADWLDDATFWTAPLLRPPRHLSIAAVPGVFAFCYDGPPVIWPFR